MEEKIIPIIILIVASVTLFAGFIWIFLSKRKGDWPKVSKSISHDGFYTTGHLLLDEPKYDVYFSAWKVSLAVSCIIEAWQKLGYENLEKVKEGFKESAVLITTPENFPQYAARSSERTAAVQIWAKKRIAGKYWPIAVVHQNILDRLKEKGIGMGKTGQPVIHEFCHAAASLGFKDPSYDHSDPRIWEAAGKENSLEFVAKKLWELQS